MSRRATERAERVESWLAEGGVVLAATDRACRSLAAGDAARRAARNSAWETPAIHAWETWVREQWLTRNREGLVLLNPLQEQATWTRVIGASRTGQQILQADRVAAAAMRAQTLLSQYAPSALRASARSGWIGDAEVFSEWLAEFDRLCLRDGLIAQSRLPLSLTKLLEEENRSEPNAARPALLLIGFDRVLDSQTALLHAWGEWQRDGPYDEQTVDAVDGEFLSARDGAAELTACVAWLQKKRQENPETQLLVVTTGLQQRRGELERALLRSDSDGELTFEFSLGLPLSSMGVARSALLVLRWLAAPISETELDWLLSTGFPAATPGEELDLAKAMRWLRKHGQERPEWPLDDFLAALQNTPFQAESEACAARLRAARDRLQTVPRSQSPAEWAALTSQLLDDAEWPGFRPLASAAYQARQRWDKVVESCGSLGFDGSAMEWPKFVSALRGAVAATIFTTESTRPTVLITEPLESAGLLADGIWFLGADEQGWPGRGQPHPLLPLGLQREVAMPHSSNQADWELARHATQRLLASAEEVIFSFARHGSEAEARPSRLALQFLGDPKPLPDEIASTETSLEPQTEWFEDASQPAYPHTALSGGAAALTRQSNCPFQAFGVARLAAEEWEPAEAGLNARQRGQLLHGVLLRIWGGDALGGGPEPEAIRTLEELRAIPDLTGFVRGFVERTMRESFLPGRRNSLPERFPARLLQLEADRLTGLVSEWLTYERQRLPFSVDGTELSRPVTVAGLSIDLRLDRIDAVANGGKLVIDYKTGNDSARVWDGDRPENVQLPLYATHAVEDEIEGLVFARVKAGDVKFYGSVRNASASLQAGLSPKTALVQSPLTSDQLEAWRQTIERLGSDFKAGRAGANPKDRLKTCQRCHLHAVCRIYENPASLAATEDADGEEEFSNV